MFLSGITDEAGSNIDTQIKATRELGWKNFEARVVEVTVSVDVAQMQESAGLCVGRIAGTRYGDEQ